MSLTLNANNRIKLSQGGLGGASFGASNKSSNISNQATVNLSNSSAARRTNHYSFSRNGAARRGFVPGQNVSKGANSYNYQGLRARLNSGPRGTSSNDAIPMTSYANANQITYQNTGAYNAGNTVGTILSVGVGIFGMLNKMGVLDIKNNSNVSSSNPTSNTSALDGALNSLGGNQIASTVNSSVAQSAISNMKGCNDSASLRQSIAAANQQLASLQGQTASIDAAAAKAEQNIDTYKENVKSAKDDVKSAEQDEKNAKQGVTASTNHRDSCQLELEKADANYGKATQDHQQKTDAYHQAQANTQTAQTNYDSAKATFDNTPEKIKDANGNEVPNPKYEAAKQAMEQAKAKLEQAQKAEEDAKKAMDAAEDAKTEAKKQVDTNSKAVTDAEKKLEEANNKLDKQKENLEKAQEKVKDAQEKLGEAERQLADAEGAIKKAKQHKEDVKNLQEEINDQQNRLTKLENEEIKNYEKYDKQLEDGFDKNDKRAGQIDSSDGMSWKEKRYSKQMDKENEKNAERLDKRNALSGNYNDTQYIRNTLMKQPPDATVGGQAYRKGTTPSGQTVYYRDSMPISEEEYNNVVGVSA